MLQNMVIFSLLVCGTTVAANLIAETEFGKVQGKQVVVNGVTIKKFLGVPYGAAPAGNLRWKPPTNPKAWSDIKSADTPFLCPHVPYSSEKFVGDEKTCLQANLWVPVVKKPIKTLMVWIHGGGNAKMGPPFPVFEGSNFVARSATMPVDQSEPVIMAAIGYRLGGLGFMAMPELTDESPNKSSGNYGTLDQIFALKWLRRNIHAFGGVKDTRVVIMGESSGAYNIGILLASPLATGLFDGAVHQSGHNAYNWKTLSHSEKTGTACAAKNKCEQKSDREGTLACMRALSPQQAYECMPAYVGTAGIYLQDELGASVDGHVLKCNPIEALQASGAGSNKCGKLSQATVMVGATSKESNRDVHHYMIPGIDNIQAGGNLLSSFIATVFQSGEKVRAQDYNKLWPVQSYAEDAAKLNKCYQEFGPALSKPIEPFHVAFSHMAGGDVQFVCTSLLTSSAIAGLKSSRRAYLYLFDYTPTEHEFFSLTGPVHTMEVAFLFGNFDAHVNFFSGGEVKGYTLGPGASKAWTPTAFERKLSHTIMDYWLDFGRTLNPNRQGSGRPRWTPAGCGKDNNYLVFSNKEAAVAVTGKPYFHAERCAFLQSYTTLPVSTCPTYDWKVTYPSCTRGYWASGCGQPALKQKAAVACYASVTEGGKQNTWKVDDKDCEEFAAGKKPAANERTCPATKPCPRCKGCTRTGECWKACGGKAGKCSACASRGGRMGACCQRGNKNDPIECRIAEFQFETDKAHTCALLPQDMHMGYLLKNIVMRLDDVENDVKEMKK